MPVFFFTVEQQERAIVERFGKFVRVAGPGLQRKSPFVEKVAGRMSLQVEQLNADIETKTRDNVFVVVKLAIQYMVGADEAKVKDAFYKLDDPEVQMKSYAFDVVRSHIPTMDLDEAYADADTIAKHIQDTLQRQMADYGYEIIKALITNIEPDQRVKDAMNNINAARRNQEAATAQGEGDKTLRIKKAEAESESMRLHGEGVAAERKAIAHGLKDSLALIADEDGIDAREAMALVALTQYMDTIRSVGEHGNMTTLLLPALAGRGRLVDGAGPRGHAHRQPRCGRRVGRRQRRRARRSDQRGRPGRLSPKRDQSSGQTMDDPSQGMLAFLGVPADPRLLDEDLVNVPAAEQYHAAGRRHAQARPAGRGWIGPHRRQLDRWGGDRALRRLAGSVQWRRRVRRRARRDRHPVGGHALGMGARRRIRGRDHRRTPARAYPRARRRDWLAAIQPYPRFSVSTSVLDDASTRVERVLHRPVLTARQHVHASCARRTPRRPSTLHAPADVIAATVEDDAPGSAD